MGASVLARALDQDALRAKAQAVLAAVTMDIDKANIAYSPAGDGAGSNFNEVLRYQQEYQAGSQSFQDGRYGDALTHLLKADEIIRRQPNWSESE